MTILAIDTAANLCAVCLWDEKAMAPLSSKSLDIGRGHAEHLLSLIDDVLTDVGKSLEDVTKLGVNIGPGSFTGIRVGVAAARGLGLALDIPVVGVSTFSAIAYDVLTHITPQTDFLVALSGGRGQLFVQHFDGSGVALSDPSIVKLDEMPMGTFSDIGLIVGNGAAAIEGAHSAPQMLSATGSIEAFAALAVSSELPPKPLYLRSADAKINEGFALPHAEIKTT